ncbi:MAG: DUF177 domain-containing protein [Myxococcales bacterium]|nr:DUF177 domain-containing protein [Myxococcales bacterium]
MAIAIRLEILADGPRSGTETVAPTLLTSHRDCAFEPGNKPLSLDWTATEVARVVELKARLRGELSYGCARCTDPLTFPLDVAISHHWVPAGGLDIGGDEVSEFDRDPDVSEHNGVEIDIESVVLECVMVDLPFAPDCDVSAQGRCPDWTDEARIVHHGGKAPEVEGENPFAALAGLKLTSDAEA